MSEDRYSQSPKVKGGKVEKPVKAAAEKETKTAGSPPSDANPKGEINQNDPGPEGGHDATWGKVADRHTGERKEMLARHKAEHEQMISRHHDEHNKLAKRHEKELAETAPNKDETTAASEVKEKAGSPKELGKSEGEGKKGTEP